MARAGGTASHDAAIAILTEALGRDPGHAEITSALGARRTALEDDARRARERREKVAAALAKAAATPAHDAAIAVLNGAVALDPGNPDVRQALEARQAALGREQEEARRAREREERIASAIANAKKTTAHEGAIAILKEALALDPKNTTLRGLLDTRQAALDREREQARLEAERQAKVASAIKQARSAKSHEAAIALLKEAVALDGTNKEARVLLETREKALEPSAPKPGECRRLKPRGCRSSRSSNGATRRRRKGAPAGRRSSAEENAEGSAPAAARRPARDRRDRGKRRPERRG